MIINMKRLLSKKEKILVGLVFGSNKQYLNNLYININAEWIKYFFCKKCIKCKMDESKYGMVINKNIYFSFDPNYSDNLDMHMLIHEITHYEQCLYEGYCCLIPKYLYDCICFGPSGMYYNDGTLEYEAEQKAELGLRLKKVIDENRLYEE